MRIPKNRLGKLLGLILVLLVMASNTFIILNPNAFFWDVTIYKARTGERSYVFNGTISRAVLESYLSRAVTFSSFLRPDQTGINSEAINDNFRFIANTGAKFIGRAIFTWCDEISLLKNINISRQLAQRAHVQDPEMILQGAIFEAVSTQVNSIPIPAWVFHAYGLAPEARNFSFTRMFDPGWKFINFWGQNTTVPDMSKIESRLWFFFIAAMYIDIGIEALHLGQVADMTANDPDQAGWRDMMQHVRAYATIHARRHMVICDAHVPNGGYLDGYNLLFDFHSFPLRPEDVLGEPQNASLAVGYIDSLYQRSKGGVTPSGWACNSLPYLVEFDNFGDSDHPGQHVGWIYVWGYDEITWYALQPENYRDAWLWYAVRWLEQNDPNGFLEMPGSRPLSIEINGGQQYFANTASANMTNGFNQEATIKSIWQQMPNFYLT
ncbi:MAG TPA: hypothetical protein VKM55_00170 [Candidatus Lokiarchaeia archaeon]|nr:hypothetical protein [Candidatus Lokiarchaeia archaeon]